jgi:undecaprenyl-diphosphatase
MIEAIVSGMIQGIAEWLPISSEGLLILVKKNIFGSQEALDLLVQEALFLHLGTFLAALIYFRKDVWALRNLENQKILKFLILTTLITGLLGFLFLKILVGLGEQINAAGDTITLMIGGLLLITAFLQIKAPSQGYKKPSQSTNQDGLLLGLVQGLATLPGLSRSGLTIATLLLRKFDGRVALKLSFLMSLPVVLGGNIVLNLSDWVFSIELMVSLIFAFGFGFLTIAGLLRLAQKINFGYLVLIFGLLVIVSVLI